MELETRLRGVFGVDAVLSGLDVDALREGADLGAIRKVYKLGGGKAAKVKGKGDATIKEDMEGDEARRERERELDELEVHIMAMIALRGS